MDTEAIETIAMTEGMGTVKLLLHVAAQALRIDRLEREVAELKARLQVLEPHEVV